MGWDLTKEYIERDREFFKQLVYLFNAIYHDSLIKAPLLPYNQGKENIQNSLEAMSSSLLEVVKKTSEKTDIIRASYEELEILKEVNKYYEICKEKLNKPYIFHEFGTFVDLFTNWFGYLCYRLGRSILEEEIIIYNNPPKNVYKKYEQLLFSYGKKWDNEFYANSEEKGIITFCVVDSLDNTLFPKLITSRNPKRILLEEVPVNGIKRFFGKSVAEEINKNRENYIKNCYMSNIKRKGDKQEYLKYINKLKELTLEYVC